jgi:hypothetical protein
MRTKLVSALAFFALALPGACSDSLSTTPNHGDGIGALIVRLTDAPFLTDSLKSVDIFVVRVDGRVTATDDNEANSNLEDGGSSGWQTLASPNAAFNLLALQNGVSTSLGQASLAAGTYNGFRFIIDPSKSSVTLKNGLILTGTSSPNVTFPSASKSGIKIVLSEPVKIVGGATTTLLVDFDVNNSFVQRGNSIEKNGLLFKPVIKATVTDAATVNATIRLANASALPLSLLQSGNPLAGGTNLLFATTSACSSVNAATPALTVIQVGSTTPLAGFAPTLAVGSSYTVIAYPNATAGVQFTTLANAFVPTTGQSGLRVFNAAGGTSGFDVFVTATGAVLGTAAVANVLPGASSAFVSVPAGASQVRLTTTGSTTVLLDMGAQTFTAGQNATLVIAPPATGSTVPRAFLVAGC